MFAVVFEVGAFLRLDLLSLLIPSPTSLQRRVPKKRDRHVLLANYFGQEGSAGKDMVSPVVNGIGQILIKVFTREAVFVYTLQVGRSLGQETDEGVDWIMSFLSLRPPFRAFCF